MVDTHKFCIGKSIVRKTKKRQNEKSKPRPSHDRPQDLGSTNGGLSVACQWNGASV